MNPYVIGIDFGTNSVRALLIDSATGKEACGSTYNYRHGLNGVITDKTDHFIARQNPADYTEGLIAVIEKLLANADAMHGFSRNMIKAIGVDTTASTPLPLDKDARPLGMKQEFSGDINSFAWLWKDHSAHAEADEIVDYVKSHGFDWLDSYSGWYSPEWFWAKILRCARISPDTSAMAATWVEQSDFIPLYLTGTSNYRDIKRNACAAGYKDMFNKGYPSPAGLARLSPELERIAAGLPSEVIPAGRSVGNLSPVLARHWGLPDNVVIASGLIDAHAGAIGAGITPGSLVKNIGTSSCDMALMPYDSGQRAIPGISGVVRNGIIPGFSGIEAGQAAVGDVLNWYVTNALYHDRAVPDENMHAELTAEASKYKAGQSGLVALDWMNGNRNILMDQRLSGLIIGQSLLTSPAEVYRALIEATGFGARVIIERLKEYKVPIDKIICCGGIAEKNPLFMQIYADIFNMPVCVASSANAPALGAAMAAGVAAGVHSNFDEARKCMVAQPARSYVPDKNEAGVYDELYQIYLKLHNAFGPAGHDADLSPVMKELLHLKRRER
jgi:L-ribulokinase